MSDTVRLGVLLFAFALAASTHVFVSAGLVARRGPGRAALAFLVPPLAPALAWRAKMRVRAMAWLTFVALYVVAFVFARG